MATADRRTRSRPEFPGPPGEDARTRALAALVAHLPGGAAFVVDRDLRYAVAEGEALRAAGLAPHDLVGRTVTEVFGPERGGQHARLYRQALDGAPFAVEHKEGGRVYATRGAPLRDADGTVVAALAVSHDVTDDRATAAARERLLAESERARAAAEAAARLKSEFLSTMSHEFRTPLNAILGYAQLVDLGILGDTTPAQHEHLGRLQASAHHLLHLVDDVLDVAKADADRLAVRRDVLATGAAVAAAVALVQPQATAKGIRLLDLGTDGPGVPFTGDEHRVRQILVNLLGNAVKFTAPGGEVTIACGAAAEPDPGAQPGSPGAPPVEHDAGGRAAWAFVRVADTGPGLTPAMRGRLFEPFAQADGSHTRQHGGTGLGLAISRRLARLMGGDLTVHSPTSGGAAFTLWLPAPAAPAAPPPDGSPAGGRADARRRTPTSVAAVGAAPNGVAGAGLDGAGYAVLHALGTRLAADSEIVAERYVRALRAAACAPPAPPPASGCFPGARTLPAAQLRDHAPVLVSILAAQLMTLGELRGHAPELLGDSTQMLRAIAEIHGGQRQRLGWAEADLEREMPLLRAEVDHALGAALATTAAADAGAPGPADAGPVAAAAHRYAVDVAGHVLNQALRTSVRAFRFAHEAEAP